MDSTDFAQLVGAYSIPLPPSVIEAQHAWSTEIPRAEAQTGNPRSDVSNQPTIPKTISTPPSSLQSERLEDRSATHPTDHHSVGLIEPNLESTSVGNEADREPLLFPVSQIRSRHSFIGDANNEMLPSIAERILQKDISLSPLVFCGPSGVGKTTLARTLVEYATRQPGNNATGDSDSADSLPKRVNPNDAMVQFDLGHRQNSNGLAAESDSSGRTSSSKSTSSSKGTYSSSLPSQESEDAASDSAASDAATFSSTPTYLEMPAADFARLIHQAYETNTIEHFREKFAELGGLLLDNLQEIEDKPAAQHELRLLLDQFESKQRWIIISHVHEVSESP